MARTNKNIFDWLKPGLTSKEAVASTGLEDEECITSTEEDCLREERLEQVRMRQTAWSSTRMCRELLMEAMKEMEIMRDRNEHLKLTRIKPSEERVVVLGSQTYPDHHGGVHSTHRCPDHLPLPKRVWTWAG